MGHHDGASVTYTDGPMALSLAHMTHETEDETERTATMLSASYTLAPGVALEDLDLRGRGRHHARHSRAMATDTEGSAFVTGIALSF